MLPTTTPTHSADDCTICLSVLASGTPILTLACNHKFHLQCLATNIKANNHECPLCRATIEDSILKLFKPNPTVTLSSSYRQPQPTEVPTPIPSVEDLVDETAVTQLCNRLEAARQAAHQAINGASTMQTIAVSTTLEYGGQLSNQQSNIYGLITLKAPDDILLQHNAALATSHVPIDLVCVVDQSSSMQGEKITLLKRTLVYIVKLMSESDRLSIISFNTEAFDRSHGLKRMNQTNKQTLIDAIDNDITSRGGTYIGSGLQMAINTLNSRQTKNPLTALLLLTDGQDNEIHDYNPMMNTLPSDTQCHTFGYGPDHTASLLVQLAELGNGGSFTYIDEEPAIGPSFAMALGGLFTCVARQVRVIVEMNGDYKITNVHSKYKYEPEQLPSTRLTLNLHDLNAEEKRNIVFQIYVPKIDCVGDEVELSSQEPTAVSESCENGCDCKTHTIGNVTVSYIDPNTSGTITTDAVNLSLVRGLNLPSDLCRVNHALDVQRNRVETAMVLQAAMAELDYRKSRDMLKAQVEKIEASASAADPFCQQLIQDLKHQFPSESSYRSSNQNRYRCHVTERGTYASSGTGSTEAYLGLRQQLFAGNFRNENL